MDYSLTITKKNMKYTDATNNSLVTEGLRLWKGTLYRRDYFRAFALFSEAASQGDADGINMVGMSYFNGRGVEKDTHKAAVNFLRAARMGHAQAQYNLGLLLCGEGKACSQGLEKSVHWFRKAAVQGYVPAFWEMGNAYREGLGVERDFKEAAAWFNRGVQAGDSSCMTFLGLMLFRGEGTAEDEKAAVGLWREAAGMDNSDAMFYLGICCENGFGCLKKSGRKAAEWYRMSDYHGSTSACEALSALYRRRPLLKIRMKTMEKVEHYKCRCHGKNMFRKTR